MLIESYINKKIAYTSIAIVLVLALIVLANLVILVSKESLSMGYMGSEMILVVVLKTIRDIPMIISLGFILSVLITLTSMYKNSEAIILNSNGIGSFEIFKFFKKVFIIFLVIYSLFVMFFSPFSISYLQEVKNDIGSRPEYFLLKEKKFHKFTDSNFSIHVDRITNIDNKQLLGNIFAFSKSQKNEQIIVASEGIKYFDPATKRITLDLNNGSI